MSHHEDDVWEIRINGVKNCILVYNYFDLFKLKTKKYLSYSKWKEIIVKLQNGDHLNPNLIDELHALSKNINNRDEINR